MGAKKSAAAGGSSPEAAKAAPKPKASPDVAVRKAAVDLAAAIAAAKGAGYTVTWPGRAEGLAGIAISASGKVRPAS